MCTHFVAPGAKRWRTRRRASGPWLRAAKRPGSSWPLSRRSRRRAGGPLRRSGKVRNTGHFFKLVLFRRSNFVAMCDVEGQVRCAKFGRASGSRSYEGFPNELPCKSTGRKDLKCVHTFGDRLKQCREILVH